MSSDGEGAASYTAELARIATQEKDRIDLQLQDLGLKVDALRTEKRKIDSVLKALNGSVAKPGPKRERDRAGKPFQISAAKREQALNFITDNEGEITSTKLREALNTSGSYAASILSVFREEGLVRLAATQGSLRVYRSTVYS